ncbi:MAG: TRAP transporter TatT component family protein [Deltaproteobacteria bacterium]
MYRTLIAATAAFSCLACGAVQSATKAGMKPILTNGIDGFVSEPDEVIAEGALLANMKLIEGVVATYPDDVELLEMAAMARANYAFGFVQDELEALRLAHPDRGDAAALLLWRLQQSYAAGRSYAERALAERNGAWRDALKDTRLEDLSQEDFEAALDTLGEDEANALFWLAFTWGGAMQAYLDPSAATQAPKVEKAIFRVLALDEQVFYGVGPHMLAGVFFGFRAPAIGGDPVKAEEHLDLAQKAGDVLLPEVLKAQFVYAQTEAQEKFVATLTRVIGAKPNPQRGLLEALAKKRACRLLANLDSYFLDDAKPVPDTCRRMPHKYRLRAEPLEPPEEEEEAPAEAPAEPPPVDGDAT